MASFNKVILMGNLTRDPQVRYTPSGTAVTDLGLAVNRTWFDKQTNQRKEETTFVDVTLWGRSAEVAGEYLAKGRGVLIEGRLHLDSWDRTETKQAEGRRRKHDDAAKWRPAAGRTAASDGPSSEFSRRRERASRRF